MQLLDGPRGVRECYRLPLVAFAQDIYPLDVCVCVCVCVRERERERERVLGPMIFFRPRDRVIFFLRHFIKKMLLLRFHCHTSLDQQKITRCGTARRSHLPYTVRRLHSRHCRHCRQAITLRRTPSAHLACVEMCKCSTATIGKSGVSGGDGGSVRQVRAACNGQRVASSGQQAAGGARAAGRAGSNPAHASDNGQAITVEHW